MEPEETKDQNIDQEANNVNLEENQQFQEEVEPDLDLVKQDLLLREKRYVQACLLHQKDQGPRRSEHSQSQEEDESNQLVAVDQLFYQETNGEFKDCYTRKVCDKVNDSMLLQIIKDERLVFQETIQKTYHLFGLAKLAINADYISYMQNGSFLYYFKQVIVTDGEGKKSRRVRLMQVDLSGAGKLKSEEVKIDEELIEKQIFDDPKAPQYKGTLVGMVILPSYEQTNSLRNGQKGTQAFLRENFVLFLYKSNRTPSYFRDSRSAGDSFTIYGMDVRGEPLYDSSENQVVFSQEIQTLGPIFLRIQPSHNFSYQGNFLDSNDEIIFLSFLEPDDDDDIEGLLNEAHRKTFHAINNKFGRDKYLVLKVKHENDGIKIINIDEDENKKMDQRQLKAQNEKIKETLDDWAAHVKERCGGKLSSCLHVDKSESESTRRFCQINDILREGNGSQKDISVLLDKQANTVHILEALDGQTGNQLRHQSVSIQEALDAQQSFDKNLDLEDSSQSPQLIKDISRFPNQLENLNKLLFLVSAKESHKLSFNVHQCYNNLVAYHNDLEHKVAVLKEDQNTGQSSFRHMASTKLSMINTHEFQTFRDTEFEQMNSFASNIVTHKSKDFVNNEDVKQQMQGRIYVGMNIQIRWNLRSASDHDHDHAHQPGMVGTNIFKRQLTKCLLDIIPKQYTCYFQLVKREFDPTKNQDPIRIKPCLDDSGVPTDEDALIIVPEKVTYSNDDRSIRPFLLIQTDDRDYKQVSRVRKLWLAMIDIQNGKIDHINEQRIEGDIHVNYKSVSRNFKLVMSSSLREGNRTIKQRKGGVKFIEQMYQLYIKYDNVDYAVIKEYRMRWAHTVDIGKPAPVNMFGQPKNNNQKGKKAQFKAWSRLVGQKFIASSGTGTLQKSELFPLFDDQNNITGTQIFTGHSSNSKVIEIPNLEQEQNKYHKQFQNHSNYRRYRMEDGELVIFEVGLSNLMKKHLWVEKFDTDNAHFSCYDLHQILDNGLRVIMNLVPMDFLGLVARDDIQNYPYMGYSLVSPLEILDGETIISKTVKNPQVLEALIGSKDSSFDIQTFTLPFIQRLARRPEQLEFLLKNQYLYDRASPETSMGMDLVPLLRKVLINKEPTQIRLIAGNLFDQNDSRRYEFLMGSLYEAENSGNFQYFYPFFSNENEEQQLGFDRKVDDPRFKNFMSRKRKVVTYQNVAPEFEQEQIIEKIIYEEQDEEKYDFEVEHSFIDFRPMILDQKIQALVGRDDITKEEMQIRMNEFEIAYFIDQIFNDDFPEGEIDNQKILRVLITHQFNKYSRGFYNKLCVLYFFGYFIPLMAQIMVELSDFLMVLFSMIFFMTHLTLFYIETIQMRSQSFWAYITNWVNVIECFSFFSSIFFTYMKFKEPANRYFANHSEVFKVSSEEKIHVAMILTGGFLVIMSMFKLLSLLKSFDTFGNFVYLVIKCVKSSVMFCLFLGAWVFIFTMLLMVIGCRFDDGDYPGLSLRDMTLIQVYRNSIGDIAAPKYDLWYDPMAAVQGENGGFYQGSVGKLMVMLIWAIWFLNQFFCMVMLMNFLIAIISDEYASISTYQSHYTYMRRKELNFDCLCVYNFFQLLEDFNTLIIWSDPETEGALGQNRDMASNIKQFVIEKNDSLQKQLMDNMRSQSLELHQTVEGIHNEIDEVKKAQSGDKDRILTESREQVQIEVSDILRQNENHLSAKFVEAQREIKNLRDVIDGSGQGNQGIQKQSTAIIEQLQGKLSKIIKGEVGKVIEERKDMLEENIEKIKDELQKELNSNSNLQGDQETEINHVLEEIKVQEDELKNVKKAIGSQELIVQNVVKEIKDMKEDLKQLKTSLPTQQKTLMKEMSETIGSTLTANLTQIMGDLNQVKESKNKKTETDEKVDQIQQKYDQQVKQNQLIEEQKKESDEKLQKSQESNIQLEQELQKLKDRIQELEKVQPKEEEKE